MMNPKQAAIETLKLVFSHDFICNPNVTRAYIKAGDVKILKVPHNNTVVALTNLSTLALYDTFMYFSPDSDNDDMLTALLPLIYPDGELEDWEEAYDHLMILRAGLYNRAPYDIAYDYIDDREGAVDAHMPQWSNLSGEYRRKVIHNTMWAYRYLSTKYKEENLI